VICFLNKKKDIVEQKSNRFQIDKQEIENRKKFVTTTKEELQKIKDKLNSEDTKLKIQFDQRSVQNKKKILLLRIVMNMK
jgi:hypothetical protein